MADFTIGDLVIVLRECAGEDESVDLNGDILDHTFDELGYDSLALFNTISRIERDLAVYLPEDIVDEAMTPRTLLKEINASIEQHV